MSKDFRILVADSNPEILNVFLNILKEADYSTLSANTVKKCSSILAHDKPDVLILSTQLVDQQGVEFYRMLKTNPEFGKPFVILISLSPFTAEFRANALREGLADGYLIRPYEDLKVLAWIHTAELMLTARRELKFAISKSDNLVASMQEGVYVHELIYDQSGRAIDYRILEANAASERQLNIKVEHALGKLASELFDAESPPFLDLYAKVAETGLSTSFEQYFPPMEKYFNISVYSLHKGMFATVFSDITEHKVFEKVLLESEEKYKNLVRDMQVGVILQDPKAQILMSNQKALELLGLTEDQLLGKTSFDPSWNVIHEDGSPFPGETHPVPQAIALNHSVDNVIMGVYRPSVGDRIWLRVDAEVQRDKSGILSQVVCSFVDISDRKEAEAILEAKIVELAKVMAERDKFFSILAHDLRTPFNGFLGLTQIIAEDLNNLKINEVQEIAIQMSRSATNLYRLLTNLLEWSKVKRGLVHSNPIQLNLRTVIDENILVLQESAAMKEVVISTDISTEMRVLADPNMLHTILRNLLSNALKFTRAGGNVMVSAKSDHHSWIEISIHDTGIGMTQEHVNNLFKIDVDTKRQGTQGEQSTGLGLMLCKEFVEINKGRIWVKSKVGIGSTFYFTLPCALN
jgi:PAS domain S-box-containing protein